MWSGRTGGAVEATWLEEVESVRRDEIDVLVHRANDKDVLQLSREQNRVLRRSWHPKHAGLYLDFFVLPNIFEKNSSGQIPISAHCYVIVLGVAKNWGNGRVACLFALLAKG